MFKEEDVFTVIITAIYTFFIASVISHILIAIYIQSLCMALDNEIGFI